MEKQNSVRKATVAAQYGEFQRGTKHFYWSTCRIFKPFLCERWKTAIFSKGKISHLQRHAWNHSLLKHSPRRSQLDEGEPLPIGGMPLSADPVKRSALIRSPISVTRIQQSTASLPRAKLPARERHASCLICYLLKVSAFEADWKWLIGDTLLH